MLEQNKWYEFTDYLRRSKRHLNSIESTDLFCSPANKWLREAWIAGEFGSFTRPRCVRLTAEGDWPDFEMEFEKGASVGYEAVEADRSSRERGQEWRLARKAGYPIEHRSHADLMAELKDIPRALARVVGIKLRKAYPKNAAGLVIYLNMGWSDQSAEVEVEIATRTKPALETFSSVWTLWGGRLYRTLDEGTLLKIPSASGLR